MKQKIKHLAVIMDGNRRWAKKHSLPNWVGHQRGVSKVFECVKAAVEQDIKYVTFYALSSENLQRSKEEVEHLLRLLKEYFSSYREDFLKNGAKLNIIGDYEALGDDIAKPINQLIEETKHNNKIIITFAINYGARAEIIKAIKTLPKEKIDLITEQDFKEFLYTKKMPDPDLLIRTGGDFRISNFLLWQISYTEIMVLKKLWPETTKKDFIKAIKKYYKIERRYGK